MLTEPSAILTALAKAKTQFSTWWKQAFVADGLTSESHRDCLIEALEEVLLKADFGWTLTELVLDKLSKTAWVTPEEGLACLKATLLGLFPALPVAVNEAETTVPTREIFLIAGVNGAGKTTSLAKLAYAFVQQGKTVRIAAGDTFRAAADNQSNLMAELQKIRRTVEKFAPVGVRVRVLLVLEALVGQNALQQATLFGESLGGLDGFILTKLDSSAKAGMVFQLAHQLGLLPWWVATGEQLVDLTPFDASAFIDGLLSDVALRV